MNFDLFCLMPQRDPARNAGDLIREAAEQTMLAEALGFNTTWYAEHHFSNYSMNPSPLMMAAYCAGRTSRIRLGSGVLVLPLYEPVRLVEEIAFVDQVSSGRLALGIGSGYQEYEFQRFGRDLAHSRQMFMELLDLIEMAATGHIDYEGEHFQIRDTPLGIRPLQQPLPDLYVAGLAQDAAVQERIARSGYTPFVPQHHRPASAVVPVRQKLEDIRRGLGMDPASMRFAVQRFAFVTDDPREALEAAENIRYTIRLALSLRFKYQKQTGAVLEDVPFKDEPALEAFLEHAPIGNPERVASVLAEDIRLLRPTHLSLMMGFGSMPHARVMNSMERFGAEVMPLLEREFGDLSRIGAGDDGLARAANG